MDGELLYADALAWARARRVVLPSEYYGPLGAQARARAFSIAGMGQLDTLQGVLDSLGAAVVKGQTFAQWRAALLDDPATLRAAALAPHRLDNIFRTNIQGAYGAGIARQQEAPGALRRRPFFQYDAINDSRTRPAHAAMDNYVAPAGDAVWQRWTPPCGYRCRCVRVALTEAEARARGWKGVTHAPPAEPDEGWGYHPLHGWDAALAQARAHKLASVDPVLARGAGSMPGVTAPNIQKATVSEIAKFLAGAGESPLVVAALPPDVKKALGANTDAVIISRYTADKQAKHPEITADSFAWLQELIDNGERIYDVKNHVVVLQYREQPYLAVMKVTASGEYVFLQSFRRTDAKNIETLRARSAGNE